MNNKNTAVFIVPTGIGASIGGFAGDAAPFAAKIAKKCRLIVNPNVVNAAVFSGITENMLYTEGFAIDMLFKKQIALRPAVKNKIGIIFDVEIPKNILNIHINTINALESVYGINDILYESTNEPVKIAFEVTAEGISTGRVKNPQTLINTGKSLINKGCSALGVVCLFEDTEENDEYSKGMGVDPVGGVEAIISHILTKEFMLPVAHAPAFKKVDISTKIVDKRAASEYITPTFLPCIILGLYNAPQIIPYNSRKDNDITIENLKCVIMPYNALGSVPVLKAIEENIHVFAVKENSTVLDITAQKLGINTKQITIVDKYFDLLNLF
jgi:hypothetical protein